MDAGCGVVFRYARALSASNKTGRSMKTHALGQLGQENRSSFQMCMKAIKQKFGENRFFAALYALAPGGGARGRMQTRGRDAGLAGADQEISALQLWVCKLPSLGGTGLSNSLLALRL